MSHIDGSRSATWFTGDHFTHGFLMTAGLALLVLAALISAATRAPWALPVGLLAFMMFAAGAHCQAGTNWTFRSAIESFRRGTLAGFSARTGGKPPIGGGGHRPSPPIDRQFRVS